MSSKFVALAAVALIGVGSVASARADVLFDNTTQPISLSACGYGYGAGYCGGDPILNVAPGGWSSSSGGAGPIAASFSTGSQAVSLNYMTATFMLDATAPGDGGSIAATLWSDGGTSGPSTQLASFGTISDSQLSTGFSLVSVTSSQSVVLSSNQRYWIELASSNSSASWGYSGTNAGVGVSGEYYWNQYSSPAAVSPNDGTYIMQVAVPEPASLGVLAFGLVALMAVRRKPRGAEVDSIG